MSLKKLEQQMASPKPAIKIVEIVLVNSTSFSAKELNKTNQKNQKNKIENPYYVGKVRHPSGECFHRRGCCILKNRLNSEIHRTKRDIATDTYDLRPCEICEP